jgi:hypothetical protein
MLADLPKIVSKIFADATGYNASHIGFTEEQDPSMIQLYLPFAIDGVATEAVLIDDRTYFHVRSNRIGLQLDKIGENGGIDNNAILLKLPALEGQKGMPL